MRVGRIAVRCALGMVGASACASAPRARSACPPPAFPTYAVTLSSDTAPPRTFAHAAAALAALGYTFADTNAASGLLRAAPRRTASGVTSALTIRVRAAGDTAAIDLELQASPHSSRSIAVSGEAALQREAAEFVHEFGRQSGRETWLVGARCDEPAG